MPKTITLTYPTEKSPTGMRFLVTVTDKEYDQIIKLMDEKDINGQEAYDLLMKEKENQSATS